MSRKVVDQSDGNILSPETSSQVKLPEYTYKFLRTGCELKGRYYSKENYKIPYQFTIITTILALRDFTSLKAQAHYGN